MSVLSYKKNHKLNLIFGIIFGYYLTVQYKHSMDRKAGGVRLGQGSYSTATYASFPLVPSPLDSTRFQSFSITIQCFGLLKQRGQKTRHVICMRQKQHKNGGCCRYKGDAAAKPKVSIFTSSLDHGVGFCAAIGNKWN